MAVVEFQEARAAVQAAVDGQLDGSTEAKVIDGGCGASGYLHLPASAHLTGIDISDTGLRDNSRVQHAIVGDLQSYPLPSEAFDLGICWDVLEHLEDPLLALDNLRRAVMRGGLLVVKGSNPLSFKGLLTKFTPHSFHRWYYRRLLHSDNEPFRTYLRFEIAPRSVCAWAERSGMVVDQQWCYEDDFQQRLHSQLPHWSWRVFCRLIMTITAGRVHLDETDYILVLKRPVAVR